MTTRAKQQTEHTPGPWNADDRGPNKGIVIRGANGKRIGAVWTGNARAEANARLIAAAPAMLDALLADIRFQQRDCPAHGCGYEGEYCDTCGDELERIETLKREAALAATGKD